MKDTEKKTCKSEKKLTCVWSSTCEPPTVLFGVEEEASQQLMAEGGKGGRRRVGVKVGHHHHRRLRAQISMFTKEHRWGGALMPKWIGWYDTKELQVKDETRHYASVSLCQSLYSINIARIRPKQQQEVHKAAAETMHVDPYMPVLLHTHLFIR